jgi:hypothetical protein
MLSNQVQCKLLPREGRRIGMAPSRRVLFAARMRGGERTLKLETGMGTNEGERRRGVPSGLWWACWIDTGTRSGPDSNVMSMMVTRCVYQGWGSGRSFLQQQKWWMQTAGRDAEREKREVIGWDKRVEWQRGTRDPQCRSNKDIRVLVFR